MKHFGDITKIDGSAVPPVDVITGGSPCQDLSIAGKRAGLAGERSGLFMDQIRIIKEMRNESRLQGSNDDIRPRFMVWENVPGAFSSNGGEDFRAVLEETARVAERDAVIPRPSDGKWPHAGCIMGDGWSIAWRVHDAQFWGVPQRRKRIALVADFGGETAPEILFERKGVSGDTETCREERKGAAEDAEGCANPSSWTLKIRGGVERDSAGRKAGKGPLVQTELSATLGVAQDQTLIQKCLNPWDVQSKHVQSEEGIAESLYSGECRGGGGESYVLQEKKDEPIPINTMVATRGSDEKRTAFGVGEAGDPQFTISSAHEHAVAYRKTSHAKTADDGQGWQETDVNDTLNAFDSGESRTPTVVVDRKVYDWHRCDTRMTELGDTCCTASAAWGTGGNNVPMVMEQPYNATTGSFMRAGNSGIAETLMARDYKDPQIVLYGVDCYNQSQSKEMVKAITSAATDADHIPCIYSNTSVVRRLTPMECERLQGYPDHWTDIGDWVDSKGKKHKGESDSPRYKALGNSIALPFWQWLAERMMPYLPENPTMASLFSGIGGFELVFARAGCKPVFSSEIEEYPIAVTKKHFGDDDLGLEGDYERYL